MPFLIADGTSFALPTPKPTTPWPSPTTTRALKLRFLPPLTTFVTRLIETTVSLISSCDGSTFSRVRFISAMRLKLQTGFASRVSHCLHTPVIEKPVAIEDDALDALFDQPLGDRLANRLCPFDIPAGGLLRQRTLHRRLDRRRRRNRLAAGIVDHLHIHVRDASEDRQARALHGAVHAAPDAVLDSLAAVVLSLNPHRCFSKALGFGLWAFGNYVVAQSLKARAQSHFAPVFPTFFFRCSPV